MKFKRQKIASICCAMVIGIGAASMSNTVSASEPYTGEITMFGGSFAIRGWALCDGQLLAVSSNDALFSLLGTTYGGDGETTFALPDIRGRVTIHAGTGPGLTPRQLGQKGGAETHVLTANQLPSHTHTVKATAAAGDAENPSMALPAMDATELQYSTNTNATHAVFMGSTMVGNNTGSSPAHNNVQPFLGVNHLIALYGIYPSRH